MNTRLYILCMLFCAILPACGVRAAAPVTPAMKDKEVEVWLERHARINDKVKANQGKVDLILFGDSIMGGWRSERTGRAGLLARFFGKWNTLNAAVAGDKIENLLWRLENGNIAGISPKAAVLLIGTNNSNGDDHTAEEIAEGIRAVIAKLQKELPRMKILLMGIFPRGDAAQRANKTLEFATPNAQWDKINRVNTIISTFADGERIVYLNINHVFIDKNGNIPRTAQRDFLHFNNPGYIAWGEAMTPVLEKMMGESDAKQDVKQEVKLGAHQNAAQGASQNANQNAKQAPARFTVRWTSTSAKPVSVGTNFKLNIRVGSDGVFSLVSAENLPAEMKFSVTGKAGDNHLKDKSFSLAFSSPNRGTFECEGPGRMFWMGMKGARGSAHRFDSRDEVARITADLSALSGTEMLQMTAVRTANSTPGFIIGLRNSVGKEFKGVPGQTLLGNIAPLFPGGKVDYFDYFAADGSAGGWLSVVFEFLSAPRPDPKSLRLAAIFGNGGCVLQRDQNVKIWGTSTPSEKVTVQIKGRKTTAVADASGNWRAELPPESAGGPFVMEITGSAGGLIRMDDMYFGDVWIMTGQSNMFQPLCGQTYNFPNAYPRVPDGTDNFDNMRLAIVAVHNVATGPLPDVFMDLPWDRWEPETVGMMSTVGYFFARSLKAGLDGAGKNIPLGIIKVCQGGTAIEQWISKEALAGMGGKIISPKQPSRQYNAMIAPIQNYAIKGVIWYQGEGNTQTIERTLQYNLLTKTLVDSWRSQWKNPDMPFYYVQLAPHKKYSAVPTDEIWPWMREVQASCREIRGAEMACAIDGGLQADIHPPYKDRVGGRLARIALAKTYGIPTPYRGPEMESMRISGRDATISFKHVAGGLCTRAVDSQDDAAEIALGYPPVSVGAGELAGFALCGADRVFHWADKAEIINTNQVRVSSSRVSKPVAVRYAWQNYPRCNLFNSEGLPAEPFRTDSYKCTVSTDKGK